MHDLAEAVVGDITPYQGVSKEEKRALEEVSKLCTLHEILNHGLPNLAMQLY